MNVFYVLHILLWRDTQIGGAGYGCLQANEERHLLFKTNITPTKNQFGSLFYTKKVWIFYLFVVQADIIMRKSNNN